MISVQCNIGKIISFFLLEHTDCILDHLISTGLVYALGIRLIISESNLRLNEIINMEKNT